MRYPEIVRTLARRVVQGEYGAGGAVLPSESALAVEFGVARGTVRRALEKLESERRLLARSDGRWHVVGPRARPEFDMSLTLSEWAAVHGLDLSARTVASVPARATAEEARELGIAVRADVVRMLRVISIDRRPTMVVRVTFNGWLADLVRSLPGDVPSVQAVVLGLDGVARGDAHDRLDAVSANVEDSRLLGVPRAAPLVRLRRRMYTTDGRGIEVTDLRYRSDELTLVLRSDVPAIVADA